MVVAATPSPDESTTPKENPEQHVIVATSDPELESRVRGILSTIPDVAIGSWRETDTADHLPQFLGGPIRALIFGPGLKREAVLELAGQVHETHPDIGVVIIRKPSKTLLLGALNAGVRDVVDPDASLDDLRAAVLRALGIVDPNPSGLGENGTGESSAAIPADSIAPGTAGELPSLGFRTKAAWWSSEDGEDAIASLRGAVASRPGVDDDIARRRTSFGPPDRSFVASAPENPADVRSDDPGDDQVHDAETDEIEALVAEARTTLDKLIKVSDHHAAARHEIEQANAIIADLAFEITSALEQIHREPGNPQS